MKIFIYLVQCVVLLHIFGCKTNSNSYFINDYINIYGPDNSWQMEFWSGSNIVESILNNRNFDLFMRLQHPWLGRYPLVVNFPARLHYSMGSNYKYLVGSDFKVRLSLYWMDFYIPMHYERQKIIVTFGQLDFRNIEDVNSYFEQYTTAGAQFGFAPNGIVGRIYDYYRWPISIELNVFTVAGRLLPADELKKLYSHYRGIL